jgi:N-acetylglucosaminyl-diphospho-decaprenol L-rhamnosyltransferase
MDLSIICVNWNSVGYLRECIPSIWQWTRELSFELIVVDNASPAADVDGLQQQFPAIKLIKSAKNLGFAGANNLGFRNSCGECILFLNPDTKLVSTAIQEMMQALQSLPNAGVVGCKLLNADLSVQSSSIMKFPRIWNAILQVEFFRLRWPKLWGIGPLFSNRRSPVEVEAISGACMLVKRDVFQNVGMFSEDYFMYSEDLDLCYKARRAGFRNYYVGMGTIVHHGGRSSAPEWQTVMKTTAELQFCKKNYACLYYWMFRIMLALNALARVLLIGILRLFPERAGARMKLELAWGKWKTILKTLLAHRSSMAGISPNANRVADCGAGNV